MRTRNAQISDGAGWAARWRIPDPYVDLLDNVYELTSDNSIKVIAWYNSSDPFPINQAQFNNFPVGSKITDLQTAIEYIHQTTTTWVEITITPFPKGYKELAFNWTQVSTNAPTVNELQNDFDNAVVWSRIQAGSYQGIIGGGQFTQDKTIFPFGSYSYDNDVLGDHRTLMPFGSAGNNPISQGWLDITFDTDAIYIACYNDAGSQAEYDTLIGRETVITFYLRVYD
jgi:hypothetical protein